MAVELEAVTHAIPVFPPELERDIFEQAARTSPYTALVLALVSRRVQIWTESIIYETVTLSNDTVCSRFLHTVNTRSPSFFTANVKSLCIPGDIDPAAAERVLTVCQGVANLAFWIMVCPPCFSIMATLQPIRLSINTCGLFGQGASPDFGHPFFAKVTHLEIVDWPSMAVSGFELLPCMTHLAVDLDHYDELIIHRLRHILASCRSLLVLLCLVPNDKAMVEASDALASLDDSRLVILPDADVLENWEASLNEGSDACQWVFAEAIISAKTKSFNRL